LGDPLLPSDEIHRTSLLLPPRTFGTFGDRGPIVSDQRWFCRGEAEWAAIVERLKLTACPHCRTVGTLIRHGVLSVTASEHP
jgi:hypothetical protein